MTTYSASAVSDAQIAHEKGITIQQGRALRDNPIAQMEGATGSPEIHTNWVPHDVAEGGDGVIWRFSDDGSVTEILSPVFDSRFEYKIYAEDIDLSDSDQVDIDVRRATSGTYVRLSGFSVSAGVDPITAEFEILRPMEAARFHRFRFIEWGAAPTSDSTFPHTDVTEADKIVTHATAQRIDRLRLRIDGTKTFDAGVVWLYRRLCYETR